MWPFQRQSPIERTVDTLQRDVARMADLAADEVRARVKAEAGKQIADGLERMADRVQHADLVRQVRRGERRVKQTVKKANRELKEAAQEISGAAGQFAHRVSESLEHSGAQLAHLGEEGAVQVRAALPEKGDTRWIAPTVLGFLFGFAAGFFAGRGVR
ncbi:MAG: hypothetical protein HC822_18940 [Oscillochloris sp.]|nr:hypothetical protein [Oscillochloris sp.]